MKLKIELMRFDAKSDYLPYQTKLDVEIPTPCKETLLDLFKNIQNVITDFGFERSLPCARINEKVVYGNVSMKDIIEKLGEHLFIESLSPKHTIKDLLINTAPYLSSLQEIESVIELSNKERVRYLELLPLRYASPRARFDEDYLGESLFVFLDEILPYHMQDAYKLMPIIANPISGVMNATPISPYLFCDGERFDAHIQSLQSKLLSGFPHYERKWVEFNHAISLHAQWGEM